MLFLSVQFQSCRLHGANRASRIVPRKNKAGCLARQMQDLASNPSLLTQKPEGISFNLVDKERNIEYLMLNLQP
jgi:hypothetical protein